MDDVSSYEVTDARVSTLQRAKENGSAHADASEQPRANALEQLRESSKL
jgi:hypothetical protein